LLQIFNYVLHKTHYPQDTCGIIERKIKLLEQKTAGNVQLSTKKGFKINFIRVINCLCELSFFTDKQGNDVTKIDVFKAFGNVINQDFSAFQNNMSAAKSASNSDMHNTLEIFKKMFAKHQEINNK
jgi:hypothetical protein